MSLSSHTLHCLEHKREVELYCDTCLNLLMNEKHHNHQYNKLHKALEYYEEEILSSLKEMEKQLKTKKEVLGCLDECHAEISNQQAEIFCHKIKTAAKPCLGIANSLNVCCNTL